MIPNTKINLKQLSDEHIENIIDIYKSTGLEALDGLRNQLSANNIKKDLKNCPYQFEITPQPFGAVDNKLILSLGYNNQDSCFYIHTYIVNNNFSISKTS